MKTSTRIIIISAATAIISSTATVSAIQAVLPDRSESYTNESTSEEGRFYTVGATVTPATDFTSAAESTINGVVSIKSFATPRMQQGGGGMFSDPFFEYFFGSPRQQAPQQQQPNSRQQQQQRGLGSGVIISADGYIVTNNHVIDEADRLEVTLNDNRTFDATVIGTDPTTDLALVKIDATDLPVIPMGDSEQLKVGEWVLAVGNPFGFTSTVTTGIVSAKSRSISAAAHSRAMGIESYIQTDAAVNPGNSGGALVNLAGELIGINTAIYSQTGNYAGYSFAIPTSIVKKVVADLRQYGTVQRAVLGVSIVDLNADNAREKGITAVTKGVYVGGVAERSSAREAGIKEGDVIVAVDGVATDNCAQLQEQVAKHRPGDTVKVTYVRDNKKQTVDIRLLNPNGNTTIAKAGDFADLGAVFVKADASLLKQLGIDNGVRVAEVSAGPLADAGIRKGFVIVSVNDTRVTTPADIEKIHTAIMRGSSDEKLMIIRGVYTTGKRGVYAIDLAAE